MTAIIRLRCGAIGSITVGAVRELTNSIAIEVSSIDFNTTCAPPKRIKVGLEKSIFWPFVNPWNSNPAVEISPKIVGLDRRQGLICLDAGCEAGWTALGRPGSRRDCGILP
jgi:hypothetical protein